MYDPYIEHSGVKGMHWGVRRYQNSDGSLTPAGRAHYGVGPARKFKTTVGSAIKKARKGAGRVKASISKSLKKIKTKSEERKEANLSNAILKGNVKKIVKNVDRMSDRELQEALNRARNVKALNDLRVPKKSLTEKVGDVAGAVTKGAIAVQNIAKARQERLKYRKEREQYDRDEQKRYEDDRKKWEEEHANDKTFKETLGDLKNRAGELKRKLDGWEPYDVRKADEDKSRRAAQEEWVRDFVKNNPIRVGERKPAGLLPEYIPNYTRKDSSTPPKPSTPSILERAASNRKAPTEVISSFSGNANDKLKGNLSILKNINNSRTSYDFSDLDSFTDDLLKGVKRKKKKRR